MGAHLVRRIDGLGARGKLYFSHGQLGAARTVHDKVGQWVVQHGLAVAIEFDIAAHALRVKTIAHDGHQDLGIGKLSEQGGLRRAKTRQLGADKHRMHRCRFQLEAYRSIDCLTVQEVVGVNRLRCTGPACHL